MTQITAYNTLGTQECRIVASYQTETAETREALNEAVYRAMIWNKDESRQNMIVNFVEANGMVRAI